MGVDQNPFPNAQANMVNANFPRPDQPRPRLDLGGSKKAAAERRARENQADPRAKGKAKMYPEVTNALDEKIPIMEEPPKAIVLCSRCQCEISLEVVLPKPKEPARGPTKETIKDQAQTGRPKSAGRNMIKSSAENYGPYSPRGTMEMRPNKRPLHEYPDRYERPRYLPKRRNHQMPLKYEDVDPLNPSQDKNRSMWVSVGEGKNRDVAYVSRPRPSDGSGVPTFKMPNTKAGQWYRSRGSKLPPIPLSKTQTRRAQRQYAATCKAELEWADERQAQLNRLVDLREKLRLEELEFAKADAVASLEAAAAEDMKIHRQWVNGQVVVTALDEPMLGLEAHLTGAFEANNLKAESSKPMKVLDDGPSKVEKFKKIQPKANPSTSRKQIPIKVISPPVVEEKKENNHEMVEDVRGKPQTTEDELTTEEDQVMVDVQTSVVEEEAEPTADVETEEASENLGSALADNEELYGENEEYGDDEYFEDLPEEAMEQLANECREEITKLEKELKTSKTKVRFGDFDEVDAMVVTLPLFFEAQPGQPNSMDGDVFDEVESMVQMGEPKEIEEIRETSKAEVARPQIVMPSAEKKMPEKVCFEMPTRKMSSHLKPLYVNAHFDGVPVSRVQVDTGATVNILPASVMRKLKKSSEELIPTETTVSGFVGDTTVSKGIIPLQVRVGEKVRVTAFFVVETTAHFTALLGRDWIHGNMCVPSSLHQTLQFWHEDGSVELVRADSRPFMASANAVEARFYEDDLGPLYFTGSDMNGRPTGVSAKKLIDLGAHDAQADGERPTMSDFFSLND
ncbi:hypothetical protein ACE6H2_023785 [Prunus campanulata]